MTCTCLIRIGTSQRVHACCVHGSPMVFASRSLPDRPSIYRRPPRSRMRVTVCSSRRVKFAEVLIVRHCGSAQFSGLFFPVTTRFRRQTLSLIGCTTVLILLVVSKSLWCWHFPPESCLNTDPPDSLLASFLRSTTASPPLLYLRILECLSMDDLPGKLMMCSGSRPLRARPVRSILVTHCLQDLSTK
jgi:hypothetical protein